MNSYSSNIIPIAVPFRQQRARTAQQSALLSLLAIATEKKFPLHSILDAFADDSSNRQRRQIRDLADLLESGSSLPDAIESVPGLLPDDVVMSIRVGAESGNLAPALKLAAEQLSPRSGTATVSPNGVLTYLGVLVIVMIIIVSGTMTYIVPKLAKIFEDFGTELPELTELIIAVSRSAVVYGVLGVPLFLIVGYLAMTFVEFAEAAGHGPFPFLGPSSLLVRMMPRIASGGILRSLSIAVAAGRPLAGALSTMAGTHPVAAVRRRIGQVTDDVERGHDCWQSMLNTGLIGHREATLLEAAERAGNLDWALRQVATAADSRISFRFSAVVEFVRPLLLLLFAVIVGLFVVGLFLPLVKLLNDLS